MESFRFEHIEYLYLLLALPLLLGLYFIISIQAKRKLKAWANPTLFPVLSPLSARGKQNFKAIILIIAIGAVIVALAKPQFRSKLTEIKRQGVELIIALDVSNSMLAEDIQPNRLENAKRAISRLIDQLENDKLGLIVFAGEAYIQLPITTDFGAAKMLLNAINTEIVPVQGTSIGAAINLAAKSFSPEADKSKAIIIITDGENHEEGAIEASTAAIDKGIVVHTIGMGLPQGAPIPLYNSAGQKDFRTDHEGNTIVSKLDETMLQEIAQAGHGIYIRANNTKTGLATLFEEINKMEKQEIDAKVYSEYDEKFQFLIGFALIVLILEFVILSRKNRWLRKIKLIKD